MRLRVLFVAVMLMMVVAACGPADAGTVADEALATVEANVPAGVDATVESLLPEGAEATAEALANEAMATIEAAASDANLTAALEDAFATMNDQATINAGEALTFDALAGLEDIQSYRMTVVDAPAGAEASEGQVIKEASDGNISLNPEEYERYFTTAGDYKVRLDVTSSGNQTASHEFTITMP